MSGGINIGPDDLAKTVGNICDDYVDNIAEVMKKVVNDVGKEAVNYLHEHSPERTGAYAKSWKVKKLKTPYGETAIVIYNKDHYQITHLLEHGHALRNGGRSKAYPHIKPAEDMAADSLEDKIRNEVDRIK